MPQGPDPDEAAEAGPASPASFEAALLALVPALRRYSRSLAHSDADGDDLLQDCVEVVLSRRGQWRGVNLRAWVFTIMTNLNRNRYRTAARRPTTGIEAASDIAAPDRTGDPLERARLRSALDALSAENRAVLMLVALEGYSYRETADLLAIPVGTVMSRLSRARDQLGALLAKDNILTLRRTK
ncbi:RNA polymerase sigma factor [Sinorhizobium sp. BG8]|uniref:RNA polymerase sigma factor n=1 Tax=Sinorhizobium sp. BG8 TaxID=2613773 RepID=UPI00193E84D0|nr:RNA polymerase sigma factor [Sinorhizobium sp. BG8]QRM55886.1 RNA polymerase sigma factor [Sinorhizobium sp. BG8]